MLVLINLQYVLSESTYTKWANPRSPEGRGGFTVYRQASSGVAAQFAGDPGRAVTGSRLGCAYS